MSETERPVTTCSLCKSELTPGATKCVACGGYQGNWFFLNLGVPTLGLLVALISVLSLSITLLAPVFQHHASDIRVAFQYFEGGAAHLVASNGGDRPGTIGEAWLDFTADKKPERYYLLEQTGNRFIAPGTSRPLSFAIQCTNGAPAVEYQKSEGFGSHPISKTELVVSLVQFDGKTEFEKFPVDALPGIEVINDALSDCILSKLDGTTQSKA